MSRSLGRSSIWIVLFAVSSAWSAASLFSALMQRPGADADWALSYLTQPALLMGFAIGGLFWILLYEAVRAVGIRRTWRATIGVAVIGLILGTLFGRTLSLLIMSFSIGWDRINPVLKDVALWFEPLTHPVFALAASLRALVLATIVVRLQLRAASSLRTNPEEFVMSRQLDQVTRLLCANAFLGGPLFRRTVLNFYAQPGVAPAPELGVDVERVMRACLFARRRETEYNWVFTGLGVLFLILAAAAPPLAILVFVAAAVVFYRKTWREQRVLTRHLHRDQANLDVAAAQFDVPLPARLRDSMPSSGQNLTVYRGYQPFVGLGTELSTWSFATLIDKPKVPEGRTLPFTIAELYARLERGLSALRLKNVEIRDHYFVKGTDLGSDRQLLPSPIAEPVTQLPDVVARDYVDASDTRLRHYKWIKIEDWGGELIFSAVLRCSLRGSTLYVEGKRFVLTPLAASNRKIDAQRPDGFWHRLQLALASVFAGPIFCLAAPFTLLAAWVERLAERGKRRRFIKRMTIDPLYNHGAGQTLRQALSQPNYIHYFQQTDTDFYAKVIERKLFDELVQFLDDHEIDTSDIKDRQTMILNSGVWVQGGNVTAEALAVGTGAKAQKQGAREREAAHA